MSKLANDVIDAVVASIDRAKLAQRVESLTVGGKGASASTQALLQKFVLSDILDDAILSARPGEPSFPLRMLFGALGEGLSDDTTFALASGLNFYFRVPMDEEAKLRVGIEVSRLYYEFAQHKPFEREVITQLSPLLARLMSTELARVRLESIDGAGMFDSSVHERAPGSDESNPRIRAPKSFLCRVVSSSMVRAKALVST